MSDEKWLDGAVRQVLNLLSQRDSHSARDIYVWSDGSVTNPKETRDEHVRDLRQIALFTPSESPTEEAIRETLRRGMREARESEKDEEEAIERGDRPQELPGTPPSPSTRAG